MSLLNQLSNELESLVAKAAPAVVGIDQARGQGSGLVLTQDGYVGRASCKSSFRRARRFERSGWGRT
jgi:hypothetical protein